ncbi:diaminopimelate decarboxylase [Clostridium massiliamazoniense]|uniref:diaminopimelate decarboxylase n=1 Tax=Clostridium massiliamazoniense TaxID=1347366 RepID=UPI0006D794B1|nr:diaminopimelate decarboxylase [Clostridium massiliamazoniense]
MKLFGAMKIEDNELTIGGIGAKKLAEDYETPLYIMDENLIRKNCRDYYKGFKCDESGNKVTYAGKACMALSICKIIAEEGLYLDVVSGGELYTAYKAGVPMERIYFHGNNKTADEIELAVKLGAGIFIVDNYNELGLLNEIAKKYNRIQEIFIRITPGIEAHTHEYIQTGQIDSKFGFTLEEENINKVIDKISDLTNVKLIGLHSHIGSQIFELKPFEDEVEIMLGLMNKIYREKGILLTELDLGGGFGIYYTEEDKPKSTEEYCSTILNKVDEVCKKLNFKKPTLSIEPGRSIVGNAGTTLYTVGAIKRIPGVRTYASVNGGMADNIRPALYEAKYECMVANRVESEENEVVTIAGKCCESGDILIRSVNLPKLLSGDLLAIMSTGAYGYSMANNYNRIGRPAMVMIKDGVSRIVCKRESYDDLIQNEEF